MKQRILSLLLGAVMALTVPAAALAQENETVIDGRLQGYSEKVAFEGSSVALTWLLLVLLGAICLSVMFIDAKRTHLD